MLKRLILIPAIILGTLVVAVPPASAAQCTQRRPDVEVKPASQNISPGGIVLYDLKVRNKDGRGCEATTFLIQAWAFSTGGQRLSVEFMVLPGNNVWADLKPQQTIHLQVRARADADALPGTYRGGVGAHAENQAHSGAAEIAAVVG